MLVLVLVLVLLVDWAVSVAVLLFGSGPSRVWTKWWRKPLTDMLGGCVCVCGWGVVDVEIPARRMLSNEQ